MPEWITVSFVAKDDPTSSPAPSSEHPHVEHGALLNAAAPLHDLAQILLKILRADVGKQA